MSRTHVAHVVCRAGHLTRRQHFMRLSFVLFVCCRRACLSIAYLRPRSRVQRNALTTTQHQREPPPWTRYNRWCCWSVCWAVCRCVVVMNANCKFRAARRRSAANYHRRLVCTNIMFELEHAFTAELHECIETCWCGMHVRIYNYIISCTILADLQVEIKSNAFHRPVEKPVLRYTNAEQRAMCMNPFHLCSQNRNVNEIGLTHSHC